MLIGLGWVSLEHPPGLKCGLLPRQVSGAAPRGPNKPRTPSRWGSGCCHHTEKGGLTVELLFLPPVVNKCPADGSSGSKELNI